MKKHNLNRGFTIIEVVLVLAIAGLIFLAIFLALPALQRSQRDTQRKSDMARLKAAYQQYRANNKGQLLGGVYNGEYMAKLPNWENFINEYLRKDSQTFRDPSGQDYFVQAGLWDFMRDDKAGTGAITYSGNHICSNDSSKSFDRKIEGGNGQVIRIWLEAGGVHCVDLLN